MSGHTGKTVAYATIAFIAGFAVLAMEIAGTRLIAGTLGNNIYTWSALIAAVLLSLSLGGLTGGLIIDKRQDAKWLLGTMVLAALFTAAVPFIASFANVKAAKMTLNQGAIFECGLIFIIPSFAYGAISPMCVKLLSTAASGRHVGFSAGLVSMAGSLGSFAGAVATPFWLIPDFTLTSLFLYLAGLVLVSCLLLLPSGALSKPAVAVLASAAALSFLCGFTQRTTPLAPGVIFDHNSSYHRIRVTEPPEDQGKARSLYLDTTLEGGIDTGRADLPLQYQNTWRLAQELKVPVRRALCIGAGAFGVPRELAKAYPEAIIEVAEIDPQVITTGQRFFGLGDFPQIRAVAADGRRFLNQSTDRYDLIFIDAYHGMRYIPPHLTTVEFFQLCQQHLTPAGVVMMNVISGVSLEHGELLHAFGKTVSTVFSSCAFVPLLPRDLDLVQNVVLICAEHPLPRNTPNFSLLSLEALLTPSAITMRDQLNPIESILARQLRQAD